MIRYNQGVMPLDDIDAHPLLYCYLLFGTNLVFAAFGGYVGFTEFRERMRSCVDHLTGLFNLRHFQMELNRVLAQHNRTSEPASLIYFDLDHFKRVNDTYGHCTGDKVIIATAKAAKSILRKNEILARVGGEEFALLLPHAKVAEARELAERIRKTIMNQEITAPNGDTIHTTISLGVTELNDGEGAKEFVARADNAMYAAKNAGRNRVFVKI